MLSIPFQNKMLLKRWILIVFLKSIRNDFIIALISSLTNICENYVEGLLLHQTPTPLWPVVIPHQQ